MAKTRRLFTGTCCLPAVALAALFMTAPALVAAPKPPALKPLLQVKVDIGLLEFLGSWQDHAGRWVDPMMFASLAPIQLEVHAAPPVKSMPSASSKPGLDKGVSDKLSRHS
ncbi:MAG: hypothetical protein ACRETQ_12260 [Gammaproteobacteria bacterium]